MSMIKIVLAVIVASVTASVGGVGSAAAQNQVVAPNKLEVRGEVLPNHYVTIDPDGTILEIASNTTQDVIPRIYVNKISAQNEVPLTEDVLLYYRQYVPEGSSRVGILYKADLLFASPINVTNRSVLQLL